MISGPLGSQGTELDELNTPAAYVVYLDDSVQPDSFGSIT
jgi:hypothetical protein